MLAVEMPVKTVIDNVCARLTDPQYNASLRKTGFLFFRPSDTGLYQTAVHAIETLSKTDLPLPTGRKRETKEAIRAYLDDRMTVRRHEYGRQRWLQMMCAYRALEEPAVFAEYCAQINQRRGVTDPSDENYVHPNAFEAGRTDLKNPLVPMNEALTRFRQNYQKAAAAGNKDAQRDYFCLVAALRAEAFNNNDGWKAKPEELSKKMWGTLVDMKRVEDNARKLQQESGVLTAFKKGERQEMLQEPVRALYPDPSKKWEIGGVEAVEGTRLRKDSDEAENQSQSGRQSVL